MLGQWPYLAMSRLADEGAIVAMEGDADGAVTALAGRALGAGVGYLTDWLEHDARTSTSGTPAWPRSAGSKGRRSARHFNIEKPLVVDGPIKVERADDGRPHLAVDGRYHATAFEGRTIRNPRELTGNTALVEFAPTKSRRRRHERLVRRPHPRRDAAPRRILPRPPR